MSDDPLFINVHRGRARGYSWSSPKWQCTVCGRSGYSSLNPNTEEGSRWNDWTRHCRVGHSPCPWCDRQLTLRLDGTPRVHARCPERPDDAELLRLTVDEAKHIARLGVRGPLTRQATALLDRLTAIHDEN